MKRLASIGAAILFASAAAGTHAGEFEAPRVILSTVDWKAAAVPIASHAEEPPAEAFTELNAVTSKRFPRIAESPVPVLLPFDVAAFRADIAAANDDVGISDKYFAGFHPTRFFLPGPAGYDATFTLNPGEAGFHFHWAKPIEVQITGAAYVYDLDPPNHKEVFAPPKGLDETFPGITRILSEAHVRYAFERNGVPYVVSIQCYDMRVSAKYLSCREADPVALKFLAALKTAGGTPSPINPPKFDLSRPHGKSDFTYYPPGDLIPNSGWNKMPGRADYHVYSRIRFPIANAPGYVKSQSFMPWGDCYRRGIVGHMGRKGASYHCRVNDKPLVFDESAAENFTYPWRDNFCEYRDFLVGQCPGGYGHQGEDIRPANCVLNTPESDRCLPYQHTVAAVHDGLIWRTAGNLGLYIVANTANEHIRYRYLHMNPKMMDADGWFSGRTVSEGEILGKVADWGDSENGTSYHIHFNMQVFTKSGWVWVNPYMTLVAAYERLIGGRGTEIMPGDPAPAIPDKAPVVLHLPPVPVPPVPPAQISSATPEAKPGVAQKEADTRQTTAAKTEENSAEREKPRRHLRHHRRRRHHDDE